VLPRTLRGASVSPPYATAFVALPLVVTRRVMKGPGSPQLGNILSNLKETFGRAESGFGRKLLGRDRCRGN
jgi:hypothetical protein